MRAASDVASPSPSLVFLLFRSDRELWRLSILHVQSRTTMFVSSAEVSGLCSTPSSRVSVPTYSTDHKNPMGVSTSEKRHSVVGSPRRKTHIDIDQLSPSLRESRQTFVPVGHDHCFPRDRKVIQNGGCPVFQLYVIKHRSEVYERLDVLQVRVPDTQVGPQGITKNTVWRLLV